MNDLLTLEDNPIIIRQHNAITDARYNMSALEKNIVYMLLAQLRDDDPPEMDYEISITEMQGKLRQQGQMISREEFEAATRRLVSRVYVVEDERRYVQMSLFSSVVYTDGSDKISIEISSDIRPYFFHLKNNFSEFELDIVFRLRSFFSKRMYEILSRYRYKEEGVYITTVERLKYVLDLFNPITKEEKYKEWSAFEGNILKVAQHEINQYADITFTYVLQKTGQKYTDIRFNIASK